VRLRTLIVKNFQSFDDLELQFGVSGAIFVDGINNDSGGSNESGKTTVFEAIVWCLFDETIKGRKRKEVIRKCPEKCDACSVTLVFETPDISITRRVVKNKELGEIVTGDKIQEYDNVENFNRDIEQIIGMNFVSFTNSIIFGQGVAKRFTNSTDSERKDVLTTILNFSRFYKALDYTKKITKSVDTEIIELVEKQKKLLYSKESCEKEIETNKKLADSFDEEKNRDITNIEKNILLLEESVHKTQKRLDTLVIDDVAKQNLIYKQELMLNKKNTLVEKEKNILIDKSSTKRDLDRILKEIDNIMGLGDTCPTCKQDISDNVKNDVLKKYETQKSVLVNTIEKLTETLNDIQISLSETEETLLVISKDLDVYSNIESDIRVLKSDLEHNKKLIEQEKERTESIRIRKNTHQEIVDKKSDELVGINNNITIVSNETQDKEQEKKLYEFWIEGFGNTGVVSMLLEDAVLFLSDRANYYLNRMTNGTKHIVISNKSVLKTKDEERDKISITIYDNETEMDYKDLSGGGKRRIDIPIILALRDLVGQNTGVGCNIFVADEIFDSLDMDGISSAVELLFEIAETTQVFLISHDPRLKNYFDSVLVIEKTNGVSVIKKHD